MFENFGTDFSTSSPSDVSSITKENYNNFYDKPSEYYWKSDSKIINVFVVDIYFIYNDMVMLDENKNTQNSLSELSTEDFDESANKTADFNLSEYYSRENWIKKKYYNFIRYQFNNTMIASNINIYKDNSNSINDTETIKFRSIIGRKSNINKFNKLQLFLMLNLKKDGEKRINRLEIINGATQLNIDFEDYIQKYIQNKEVEATELVVIKDGNTKPYVDNDLVLDLNTVSYVSFKFLNISDINDYKKKMVSIANNIITKYFPEQEKSIDKIKYNTQKLKIIKLDKLFRYNKGRYRLTLENRIITPNNIGTYYRDINKLRSSYIEFLKEI